MLGDNDAVHSVALHAKLNYAALKFKKNMN